MKELYAHWLRIQCETWMKENLPELFRFSYSRLRHLFSSPDETVPVAEDECLISKVDVAVGPWRSVCFHFKEPGEIMFPLEKSSLARLREQGHRVLIVRCLEDFQSWTQTYFGTNAHRPQLSYSVKSA